jgi:hypothetical protein
MKLSDGINISLQFALKSSSSLGICALVQQTSGQGVSRGRYLGERSKPRARQLRSQPITLDNQSVDIEEVVESGTL